MRLSIHVAFATTISIIVAPAFAQRSFDKPFDEVESAIHEQAAGRPFKFPENEPLPPTEIGNTKTTAQAPSRSSSLDDLMGDKPTVQRNAAAAAMTKAEFFAEFEHHYMEAARSNGIISSIDQEYSDVAKSLAVMLPSEFGISTQCVQQRMRDGRISGSRQAMAIASAMYDVIDKIASSGGKAPSGRKTDTLREKVNSLSQRAGGCPNDFPAIKQYLEEYTEFAKALVARKQNAVAERQTKEKEEAQQAKLAADKQREEDETEKREAQAQEAQQQKLKREATEKRKLVLRSGAEKPASFRDHMLMYDYGMGDQFFSSPMLKPDGKVYLFGTGTLDGQDGSDLIFKGYNGYVVVKIGRNTPIYGDIRINMLTVVIGRYVGNTQYTTVIGVVKTVPIIEAIAVSQAPVHQ